SFSLCLRRFCLASQRPLGCLAGSSISELVGAPPVFIYANSHIAQHAIIYAHAALELGNLATRPFNLKEHVGSLTLVVDFIGQTAPTHHFGPGDSSTLVRNDLLHRFTEFLYLAVVRVRVDDEN